jgi:hypothetical protein
VGAPCISVWSYPSGRGDYGPAAIDIGTGQDVVAGGYLNQFELHGELIGLGEGDLGLILSAGRIGDGEGVLACSHIQVVVSGMSSGLPEVGVGRNAPRDVAGHGAILGPEFGDVGAATIHAGVDACHKRAGLAEIDGIGIGVAEAIGDYDYVVACRAIGKAVACVAQGLGGVGVRVCFPHIAARAGAVGDNGGYLAIVAAIAADVHAARPHSGQGVYGYGADGLGVSGIAPRN